MQDSRSCQVSKTSSRFHVPSFIFRHLTGLLQRFLLVFYTAMTEGSFGVVPASRTTCSRGGEAPQQRRRRASFCWKTSDGEFLAILRVHGLVQCPYVVYDVLLALRVSLARLCVESTIENNILNLSGILNCRKYVACDCLDYTLLHYYSADFLNAQISKEVTRNPHYCGWDPSKMHAHVFSIWKAI